MVRRSGRSKAGRPIHPRTRSPPAAGDCYSLDAALWIRPHSEAAGCATGRVRPARVAGPPKTGEKRTAHGGPVPHAGDNRLDWHHFCGNCPDWPPRGDCVEVETPELHRVCPACLRLQLDGRCEPEMTDLGGAFPGTDG